MNKQQREYLLKYYKTRSVKQLAEELNLGKKEVQRELRQLLARTGGPAEAVNPVQEKKQGPAKPVFKWAALILLLIITSAVFYQGLSHPFLNWDDPHYVTENPLIRTLAPERLKVMFTRPHFSLYIPFTLISYAFDYQLWHFNAFGYHLTSLIIHLLNAALVFGLVGYLTGEWAVGFGVALLFGIHPVQIESVVWVAERKNVLSSLFFLSAFFLYVLFRNRGKGEKLLLISCIALFLAGCFSKPNIVVLPLILAAYDLSRGYFKKEKAAQYLPFIAGAVFFAAVTYLITKGEGKMNYHGGSLGPTLLAMMVVMMKYLQLLVFPLKQSLLYEFPVYPSIAHPHVGASFLGLILLFCGACWLWFKDKKLGFWAAWYFILLLPVMNLVPFPSLMNDRYLYLPLIGFFTVLFTLLRRAAGLMPMVIVLVASVSGLTLLNVKRQDVWAHQERLWLETQAMTQEKHQSPYVNLGMYYLREKQFDKAIEQFEKAKSMFDIAKAYDGLGIAYFQKGDLEKAIANFKLAVAKAPKEAGVHSNLAMAYEKKKDFESALEEFKQAALLDAGDPTFQNNLGSIYMKMERNQEAEAAFRQTLNADPDFADALFNMGLLLSNQDRFKEAEKYWSRLVAIHPNHPKAAEVKSQMKDWN